MFNTIETTWERSGRRGWSAAASFTMQAMGLSLLLLIPMFTTQGPPKLEWVRKIVTPIRSGPVSEPPAQPAQHQNNTISNFIGKTLLSPRYIPIHAKPIDDGGQEPPQLPYGNGTSVGDPTGSPDGVRFATGPAMPVLSAKPSIPDRPLRISHWSEGNLVYQVQPAYPEIARSGRIQGAVILRAIISRNGLIENLTVEKGHPMLIAAAINAVKQWRYRPYLLNNEPVEVDTEITVNFILGGN